MFTVSVLLEILFHLLISLDSDYSFILYIYIEAPVTPRSSSARRPEARALYEPERERRCESHSDVTDWDVFLKEMFQCL